MLQQMWTRFFKPLLTTLWYVGAITIVLVAITISLFRFTAPLASQYRGAVELWLTEIVKQPIEIATLEANWRGFSPTLRLKNIKLFDNSRQKVLLAFEEARIEISILSSLRHWRFQPGALYIKGVSLNLERGEDGRVTLFGFHQNEGLSEVLQKQIIDWFLTHQYLQLDEAQVVWWDKKTYTDPLLFDKVSFFIRNKNQRHFIKGAASLPVHLGKKLNFSLDLGGNPVDIKLWDGIVQGECVECNLATLSHYAKELIPSKAQIQQGLATASLWSQWQAGILNRVDGIISLEEPVLIQHRKPLLDSLNTQFAWRRENSDWHLNLDNLRIRKNGHDWPPTQVVINRTWPNQTPNLNVIAGFVRIQDALELAKDFSLLDTEQLQILREVKPQGFINDLHWVLRGENSHQFYVAAKIINLETQQWGKFPGVSGFGATLAFNNEQGSIELQANAATIHWPQLFRHAIAIEQLSATLLLKKLQDQHWQIEGTHLAANNGGLKGIGWLYYDYHPHHPQGSFIDLILNFENGAVADYRNLLALNVITPKVKEYLEHSLLQGTVNKANFILQGRLNQFPYADGNGKFALEVDYRDVNFLYAKQWPPIDEAKGLLEMEGRKLHIDHHQVKLSNTLIKHATAEIDDISSDNPIVHIVGDIQAPVNDVIHFMNASPLIKYTGKILHQAQGQGQTELSLTLDIPLKNTENTRVDGMLKFANNTLNLPNIGVELSQTSGQVHFSDTQLDAQNIKTKLWEMPTTLHIATLKRAKNRRTMIQANGIMDIPHLKKRFNLGFLDFAQGESAYTAEILVDSSTKTSATPPQILVSSDLKGIHIALPAPVGKKPEENRPLDLLLTLSPQPYYTLDMNYAKGSIRGIFVAQTQEQKLQFTGGEVRFGGDTPQIPPANQWRIAGVMSYFSQQQWDKAFAAITSSNVGVGTANPILGGPFNVLQLKLKEAEIEGYQFSNLLVQAERNNKEWVAKINGDHGEGTLIYPAFSGQGTLSGDFSFLVLNPLEENNTPIVNLNTRNPEKLSAMEIHVDELIWASRHLGTVYLQAQREKNGLRFSEIKIISPSMVVAGRGEWLNTNGRQNTRFDLKLNSDNMGNMLQTLGFVDSVRGGKSTMALTLNWPGGPADFEFQKLNGEIKLDIEKGRLLDINPGAGRIFGLLSFQSLPRRLSLDFSDLFQKGFSFDTISGEFSINNGDAFTANMVMKGPPAKIEVVGRAGLAVRDYDQVITITPTLGYALPLASVLAGQNYLGAAILFTQQLFNSKIKEITTYDYAVTGSWQSPVIESIGRAPIAASFGNDSSPKDDLFP